jgi:hypothetical protein
VWVDREEVKRLWSVQFHSLDRRCAVIFCAQI